MPSHSFLISNYKPQLNPIERVLLTLLITVLCFNYTNAQYNIPEKPKVETSVYDYINLLNASQKNSLERKLITYSDSTSTQIVVAIILSTNGENINFLGAQWGQKWGIGQAKDDNGILILLAKNDRRIAINTGYGVEHLLTDAISRRIIERDIIPFFKQNNYPAGLHNGVDAIFKVMNGEYTGTRKPNTSEFPLEMIFISFFIFIIIIISISKNKRGGGGNRGNQSGTGSLLDAIILSNMGRGSYRSGSSGNWGGSSSGGGGFGGGFGGGGFGGGGASGGW